MAHGVAPFHTPAQMRAGTELAHRLAGSILALAALLAFAESAGWAGRAWPLVLLIAAIFFVVFIPAHHGVGNLARVWDFVWHDAQQRQHLTLGALLALGAAAEILGASWGFAAALTAIALLFFTHPQHGTAEAMVEATRRHRTLAVLLVVSAALRLAAALAQGIWGGLWPLALLTTAVYLLVYREPAGAYSAAEGAHH